MHNVFRVSTLPFFEIAIPLEAVPDSFQRAHVVYEGHGSVPDDARYVRYPLSCGHVEQITRNNRGNE